MENKKADNIILSKTFDFALSIITLYKLLIDKKEFVLSKQIFRAGTSIGANVEEAIGAHSKKDIVSKMIIAYKEARETRYWLNLLHKSQIVEHNYSIYINNVDGICNILSAIIKSTKKKIELRPK